MTSQTYTKTQLDTFLAAKAATSAVDPAGAAASAQAAAIQRANHTGTQTSTTIADFAEAVQDAVAALLGAGSNVTLNYNDADNTLTIATASGTGGGLDAEAVRDAIGVALVGIGNIAVAVNDAADTITITTTATANSTDAQLRDRSSHTGTQSTSTITGLATVATSGSATDLTAGTLPLARLGTGTPAAGKYLDGSGAWAVLPTAGTATGAPTVVDLNGNAIPSKIVRIIVDTTVSPNQVSDIVVVDAPGTPDTTAPTISSFTATAGSAQVVLTWAGTDNVAVTRWVVTRAGTTVYDGTATTYINTGLTNGTAYSYILTAYDAAGNASATATATATPTTVTTAPGAPTALAATAGNAQAVLTWTAPASNGGATITDYVVQYRVTGSGSWSTFADGTSTTTGATVTGLTNGSSYDFQVAATNSVGTGTYSSSVTVTPVAPTLTLTNTVAPVITGTPTQGQTLTASTGTWSATPDSYTYVWKRSGTAIAGATATAYLLTADDVASTITVTVTAVKAGYTTALATSAATATIAAASSTGTVAADTFTRADSASLGSTETGSFPWQVSDSHSAIVSNALRFDGGSDSVAMINTGLSNNWEIRVTATSVSGNYPFTFVFGTGLSAASRSNVYRENPAGAWKLGTGTGQSVQSGGSTSAPVAGDVMVLRKQGTTLTLFRNGTQISIWTGWAQNNTAADTWQGIIGSNASALTIDNFSVVAI